jgi:hypothetical protein
LTGPAILGVEGLQTKFLDLRLDLRANLLQPLVLDFAQLGDISESEGVL